MSSSPPDQASWGNIIFRCGIVTATHPIDYAKTLIQLGYEPIAPKPTTTFLGRPALGLPSVFKYMGFIRRQDGFFGLYRGLGPKMCATIIKGMAFQQAAELFMVHVEGKPKKIRKVKDPYQEEEEEEEDQDTADDADVSTFLLSLMRNVTATSASIVASQPFHVIAVRTMAQFIGQEQKYTGIFASANEIYEESGVSGFFKGIVPRLAGEIIALTVASSIAFTINTYMIGSPSYKPTVKAAVGFITSSLTYPFTVVSTCMTVSGSHLAAGNPPFMPVYVNWTDCWSHLSRNTQLKRGSSILWRYYTGTTAVQRFH